MAQIIARESLKLSNNDIDVAVNFQRFYEKIKESAELISSNASPQIRVHLGNLIREIGPIWEASVLFSAAVNLMKDGSEYDAIVYKYKNLVDTVYSLELEQVYKLKHIIDASIY
ncbi:hypothetical protein AYI69_g1052 [Smittium culicis]|uniref:Uncharacterized protein n=1 Tax=Smittium culicis TaxID=133412 RepID=A0A1R1YRD8_9FUNG|nr:hypothetical protein AYI69_g1052 [Smittium culicis]